MKQLFPHPKLTKLSEGTNALTYEALTLLQEELFANTMAIPSVRGGGIYGHLILLHTPEEYILLEGAETFELPEDPGAQPVFPNNANAAVVAQTTAVHKAEHAERKLYRAVEKAICQQIIEATPPMHLEALKERKFGLSRITSRQMHAHLWSTYGEITPALLAANLTEMQAPWHPEQSPISTLYPRLNKAQDFADTGGEPIADNQWVRTGTEILSKTGLFSLDIRDWQAKNKADKTKTNFVSHFTRAEKAYHENNTSGQHGYAQQANAAIQDHLHHFAQQFAMNDARMALLEAQLKTANAIIAKEKTTEQPTQPGNPKKPFVAKAYCWTHGRVSNPKHTSATCRYKKEGHKDEATMDNKMGGETCVFVTRANRES